MANKLVLDLNSPVTPFEINEGQDGPDLLPNPQGLVFSADEYSSRFTSTIKSGGGMLALFKDMLPPATQSFGKICFSDDTEVLTKTGWKLFRDVSIEHDYFATLNTKTQEFEWQKASHKTYNDYCGLMYHLKSRSTDLIVTPNHRVIHYGTYKNKNLLQISTAEELYNKYGALITSASQPQMPLTSVWKGEKIERFTLEAEKPAVKDKLPANYNPKHVFNCIFCGCEFYRPSRCLGVVPEYCSTDCRHLSDRLPINMSGDDYCAFMGMYLAEGCTANNQDTGKPGYIHITQLTKSKGFTPYKELLTKIFGKEPSYLGKAFVLSNTLLAEYVKQYGRFAQDKLIPEQIMNATLTQIQIFLKYFGFGDGIEVDYATKKGFGTRVKYFTSSKKMADQLQELIQKAGYSAYIGTIAAKVSPMERTKYFADGTVATTTQMINSGVCYNVSTRFVDRRHFRIEKFHNYKGKIGCVSVPNGTLYVRRKNIPVWSGNSYMPNNSTSQLGILQWPGLPPESLCKLSKEMIGIHIVVNQRVTDIFRYSQLSEVPWRPGWSIKPLDRKEKETATLRKEIRDCEGFLANCGFGPTYANPLTRDQMLRPSFAKFLEEVVRDTLIYDGIAIWTDANQRGQIRSFAPLPAKNIRLLARPDTAKMTQVHQGELNFYGSTDISDATRGGNPAMDPTNLPFACIIDESSNVVKYFGREELVWYTRNPRIESEIGGYGFPEIEMALVLITGFNNAIQFNADIFDKNSIPKGILAIKGNFTQRQFDALGRLWDNLQRGSRTDWTLPALQLSEKGSIEVINMEALRKEPAYYNNLINLFMGALAAVYCIPVHRLGYKISGTERDSRPDTPKSMQEDDDLGLPALLTHLELIVNQYLIPSRWPLLKFEFTGKSPKEDNRLYEVSLLTKTNDERRALVGDPPYASLLPRDASKLDEYIAKTMGLAPVDPAQAGIYQSILAAAVKAGALNEELGIPMPVAGGEGGAGGPGKSGLGDIPGARMKPKKDPHESEKHSHQSGVRRHARDEKSPKTKPTKGT